MDTPGGKQKIVIINESGLYSLILSSKLPNAKQFKHWVTSEVLPSIRKHSMYLTPEAIEKWVADPQTIIIVLKELSKEQGKCKELEAKVEEQNEQIQEMLPAKTYSDAIAVSEDACLVGDVAKMLRQNGLDVGQNRMFDWLRKKGYLIRRGGSSHNMPTQKSIERGLFGIKQTVTTIDGKPTVTRTPMLTGKGQKYLVNRFISDVTEEDQVAIDLT